MSRLSCGCYVDSSGIKFARCPNCNGNALADKRAREIARLEKVERMRLYNGRNTMTARRAEFKAANHRDGSVLAHRQSDGGV